MNFLTKLKAAASSTSLASRSGSSKPPSPAPSVHNLGDAESDRSECRSSRSRSPLRSIQHSFRRLFGQPSPRSKYQSQDLLASNQQIPIHNGANQNPPVRPPQYKPPLPPKRAAPIISPNANNVENYRDKLRTNKKESQTKDQQNKRSIKMSITPKDNLAFVKSKLKQGSSEVKILSSESDSKKDRNPKKAGGGESRKSKVQKGGGAEASSANSGMSVASEPIMHYGRTPDGIYQSVDCEYQEFIHGFPGQSFNPVQYQSYSASTGLMIPSPNLLNHQSRPQFQAQHSYHGMIPASPYQLWEAPRISKRDHALPAALHVPSQPNPPHLQPRDPRFINEIPFQQMFPGDKINSQPAINYNPKTNLQPASLVRRTPNDRSKSKEINIPVMPDKPTYMRSISNQELVTRHVQQQHMINQIHQNSQISLNSQGKHQPLRVPLGLQHQFNQPAPVPLQLHYDSSDSQAIYSDSSPRFNKNESRSKRRDKSVPRRPMSNIHLEVAERNSRNEHIGQRTVSSPSLHFMGRQTPKATAFRGESDIEDELDDDVFLDPEPVFPTHSTKSTEVSSSAHQLHALSDPYEHPLPLNNGIASKSNSAINEQNGTLSNEHHSVIGYEMQFETLKQQLNDAIQNDGDIRNMGGGKNSRKSKTQQSSHKIESTENGLTSPTRAPEEHESSSNTNSGLGEPFPIEGVNGHEDQNNLALSNEALSSSHAYGKANESNLLNESELNLDTSYTTNMVKIEKFLNKLEPVTEAYLQQNPGTYDIHPKKQRRRKMNSDLSSKQRYNESSVARSHSPSDKSPIEIERLQKVRRRAAARENGEQGSIKYRRPVTPPSQRSSRRNKTIVRAQSAPPDQLEVWGDPRVISVPQNQTFSELNIHNNETDFQHSVLPENIANKSQDHIMFV